MAIESIPTKLRRLSYFSFRRCLDMFKCSTNSCSLKDTRFFIGGRFPEEEWPESMEVAVAHDLGDELTSLYPGGGRGGGSGRRG